MPFTALAIGAGAGLLKSVAIDQPREARQRQLAASTQRYSPWTGLQANPIQEADPLGSSMQFGATGAQLGANLQNSQAQQGLMAQQADWLKRGGNPSYTASLAMSNPGAYGPASPGGANSWGPSFWSMPVGNN